MNITLQGQGHTVPFVLDKASVDKIFECDMMQQGIELGLSNLMASA